MDHARLLVLAPVLLVYLGFRVKSGMPVRDAAVWALLGTYGLWAAGLLFFPLVVNPELRELHASDPLARSINLVPFATIWPQLHGIGSSPARQLGGNIGLLLPLGLFGPLVMPSLRRLGRLVIVAFALSVGVEFLQLVGTATHFLMRSVDVDDVILNVAGAVLGWLLWVACASLRRRVATTTDGRDDARDLSNKRFEQDAVSCCADAASG